MHKSTKTLLLWLGIYLLAGLGMSWAVNEVAPGDNEDSSEDKEKPEDGTDNKGFVEMDNHVFRETMPVAGTDYALHYTSWRVPDSKLPYRLNVRMFNPAESSSVKAVSLCISVTNRSHNIVTNALGNYCYTYLWDGYDAQSNQLMGVYPARVDVTTTYVKYELRMPKIQMGPEVFGGAVDGSDAVPSAQGPPDGEWDPTVPSIPEQPIDGTPTYDYDYQGQGDLPQEDEGGGVGCQEPAPPPTSYCPPTTEPTIAKLPGSQGYTSQGQSSSAISLGSFQRVAHDYNITRTEKPFLGVVYATQQGLGGWTLTPHHFYDVRGHTLYFGNGNRRRAEPIKTPHCVFSNEPPNVGESVEIVSEDGAELYVFDADGKHLKTINTFTATTNYLFTYETNGYLKTVVDADGNVTAIERDAQGNPACILSPFGLRTALTLDPNGYLGRIGNPAGETNIFRYSSGGLLTNVVTRRGYTFTMVYDELGRLLTATDPTGASNAYSRVDYYNGYEIADTGTLEGAWKVCRAQLPGKWQSRKRIAPGGITTETIANYDDTIVTNKYSDGTIVGLINGPDPRFDWQAPQLENMLITLPSGLSWSASVSRAVALSDTGNVLSLVAQTNVIVLNDRVYTSQYTVAARRIQITTPEGRSRAVSYNQNGYPIRLERSGLYTVDAAYDANGRLYSISQGSGVNARIFRVGYATNGLIATLTNSLGQVVRIHPDLIGRLTNVVTPDNQHINARYDGSSYPSGITPPGKPEHSLGYTSVGRLDRYSAPGVGSPATNMTLTWSATRKATSITRPGGVVITNTYNDADLLASVQWAEDRITIQYGPSNRLLSSITADSGSALSFQWDGRLPTAICWTGTTTGTVQYGWSRDFVLQEIALNSNIIHYGYDRDLLLTNAGSLVLRRDQSLGLVTNMALNNVGDSRQYNGFGEPTNYAAAFNGSNLLAISCGYDPLGRITSRVEGVCGVTSRWSYAYDDVGRLSQAVKTASGATTTNRYQYDANGNRTNALINGTTEPATYDAQDRLLTCGTRTYQHDPSGTITNKSNGTTNTSYRYDARGSLLAVRVGTNNISYTVDPLGRRIEKRRNGQVINRFIYQSFLQPIAELDANGNIVSRFVYASNRNVPDYMVKNGNTYAILKDHLGSVRMVVDSTTGTIAQQITYDEFGRVLQDTNPGFQPFGFAGGLYDPDTGLVRFGFRDYDAATGRWLSKDPILFAGGQPNLYLYCHGDPVNYVDPWGLGEELVRVAREHIGSSHWSQWRWNSWRFRSGAPKCNEFVFDMIKEAGLPDPSVPIDPNDPNSGLRPPRAREWNSSTVDIPGWSAPHPNPQAGDVVSDGSHVGIETGDGTRISASTIVNKVVENNWGQGSYGRSPLNQ